jgi:hypothetical protein
MKRRIGISVCVVTICALSLLGAFLIFHQKHPAAEKNSRGVSVVIIEGSADDVSQANVDSAVNLQNGSPVSNVLAGARSRFRGSSPATNATPDLQGSSNSGIK